MAKLQKRTFTFLLGHLLPFHLSKFFPLSETPLPSPLFSQSSLMSLLGWLPTPCSFILRVGSIRFQHQLLVLWCRSLLLVHQWRDEPPIYLMTGAKDQAQIVLLTFWSVPFHCLLPPVNLFSHLAFSLFFFFCLLCSHPYPLNWAKQSEMFRGFCYHVLLANRVNITTWGNDKNL